MCGIVGGIAKKNIVPVLLEGLKKLEYRGYDSAGLALLGANGIKRVRANGRVAQLELAAEGLVGQVGTAHTRWATHGVPAERNAHPHVSEKDGVTVAVVHNGIIENHEALRAQLTAAGFTFTSDTDTEVVAHLVRQLLDQPHQSFEDVVRKAVAKLEGAFALGIICSRYPGKIVAARHGAPLLIGLGPNETYLASDASALIRYTREFVQVADGEFAVLTGQGVALQTSEGNAIERASYISELSSDAVELGVYEHYMQKEVFEQPGAIAATLETVCAAHHLTPNLFGAEAAEVFSRIDRVLILACGTSYHAGMTARYWLESIARIPTVVEVASEYRYREAVIEPRTLVITISQSGETADTIAALEYVKAQGATDTLSICNVPESALIRASRLKFLTRAGPEIGVASTKAFTTQLAALFVLTLVLAKVKGELEAELERELLADLRHFPAAVGQVLQCEEAVKEWAQQLKSKHHALFLGRGAHYPIAQEGALKLKEITYIHAEAYPAGELKHGPLALVDEDMPVIVVAPNDALLEKLKGNMQEVKARGGELFVFADQGAGFEAGPGVQVITLAGHAGPLSPLLHVIPLQLLAYHTALARGADVDKPRNLAKSVTTE